MTLRYETVGEMITQNEQEKREVRMYGCTESQMREAVESSITFKFSGPAMVVAGMMSDAQEMMAYEQPDFNTIEDQRQLLNRAKFVLMTYIMDKETA
jgi:hypothetical protein